jgi:O-antigen ligase
MTTRTSRRPSEVLVLLALAAMIVAVVLVPGRVRFDRVVFDSVVATVPLAALAAVVRMRAVGRSAIPGLPVGLPFAAFLVVGAVTALFGVHPLGSALTWARYAAYPLIAIGTALACARPDARRLLLWTFVAVAWVAMILGFAQVLGPGGQAFAVADGAPQRAFATLGNPNVYAEYLGALLSIAGVLAVRERGVGRVLAGLTLVAAALSLALTYSRGMWLAVAIGVVVASALVDWRILGGFAAVSLAALVAVPNVASRLFSMGSTDPTTVSRLQLWRLAWEMASRRPITGYGLGNYMSAVSAAVAAEPGIFTGSLDTLSTHNAYLLVLNEAGVMGLAAFFWFVAASAWGCVRAARLLKGDTAARWQNAALTVGIVAFAVNGVTDISYQNPRAAVFFWMLLGLQAALVAEAGIPFGRRTILDSRVGRLLLPDPAGTALDTGKETP